MKKLLTSSLLTAVAVPFLMAAAPHAAKTSQDQAPATTTPTPAATSKTKVKKHTKKVKASAPKTDSNQAAPKQ